jgi:hypothetical protein
VIKKFILVAVDVNTPFWKFVVRKLFGNGNWEDFMIQELMPYIDANFKTLPNRDSRGIAGIFIGGYGAIRFGMRHPDVFGSVYAMHPVGTGTGVRISAAIPKWDILVNARSMDDVKKDFGTQLFTTMFQAHLPDPDKPPLFIDLLASQQGDQLIIDANFDHVYASQAFTHKLNEFGIIHEAEEYNGAFGADWGVDGRIFMDALPFFQRHLVFDSNKDQLQIEPRDVTTWTERCHRIKGSH